MRFMVMHKMTDELEKGLPPDQEVIAGVHALIGEAVKSGAFIGGEGLKPSSQRLHLAYRGGQRTITEGAGGGFAHARELVGGFTLMAVRSREEALGWCDRLAEAMGGELELFMGPVVEAWDLGFGARPADAPLRFLSLQRLDQRAENDRPPEPKTHEKVQALVAEMTHAGVLQGTGALASTRKGARIRFDGKRRVLDGPFAESKELVAGYALLDLPSKAVAIEWSMRFGEVVKVNEVEVRELAAW